MIERGDTVSLTQDITGSGEGEGRHGKSDYGTGLDLVMYRGDLVSLTMGQDWIC